MPSSPSTPSARSTASPDAAPPASAHPPITAPPPPNPPRRARPSGPAGLTLPYIGLTVRPWHDPVLEQHGHDPRSAYIERFWLPIVGPSCTLLMRHLATRFDDEPEGFELDLRDASRRIGIGSNQAPSATFVRTVERSVSFGFAQLADDSILLVRTRLPSLNRRQTLRLPRRVQDEHATWLDLHREQSGSEQLQRRARALALSLFELGEDIDATERQLHRWRFHPAIAHDAVRWAREQRPAPFPQRPAATAATPATAAEDDDASGPGALQPTAAGGLAPGADLTHDPSVILRDPRSRAGDAA